MIISHEHRFVFVKTRKTAGTSIEVMLGAIAGDDAVVTYIEPPVAGHRPRNYKLPQASTRRFVARVRNRLRDGASHPAFFNHMSAAGIRTQLGRRRWDSYFTFCFERNPWEKAVSRYYFAKGRGEFGGTFREFLETGDLPSDFDLYSFDGRTPAVDFVGRYENLEDDLRVVLDRIGVGDTAALTREKGNFRPADASAEAMFDDEMSARIEAAFAREITAFGYTRPARLTAPPVADGTPGPG